MPRAVRARASWNYRLRSCAGAGDAVLVTYDMKRLQSLPGPTPYLVSLNDPEVDPDRVIARMVYEHPIYNPRVGGPRRPGCPSWTTTGWCSPGRTTGGASTRTAPPPASAPRPGWGWPGDPLRSAQVTRVCSCAARKGPFHPRNYTLGGEGQPLGWRGHLRHRGRARPADPAAQQFPLPQLQLAGRPGSVAAPAPAVARAGRVPVRRSPWPPGPHAAGQRGRLSGGQRHRPARRAGADAGQRAGVRARVQPAVGVLVPPPGRCPALRDRRGA